DLPGTKLSIGSTIKSETGGDIRRRDVFALSLEATQVLHINVTSDNPVKVYMIYPNATSVDTKYYQTLCQSEKTCSRIFAVPTTDTYYIDIEPYSRTTYVLSTTVDAKTVPQQIASNMPGTSLDIGTKVKAILDATVKARDVYAISFKSRQAV